VLSIWARRFNLTDKLLRVLSVSDLSAVARAEYVNRAGELGRSAAHWAALHGEVGLLDALSDAVDGRLDLEARDIAGDAERHTMYNIDSCFTR